jgi:hypothetical protein
MKTIRYSRIMPSAPFALVLLQKVVVLRRFESLDAGTSSIVSVSATGFE